VSALRVHTVVPFYVLAVATLLITLIVFAWPRWGPRIVVNPTRSEPMGLYRVVPREGAQMQRGMYVVFPVPEPFRALVYGHRWLRPGVPFLKTIAALPGDQVCIFEDHFEVNGRTLGPVFETDGAGTEMPRIRGCFAVPAGTFLPASTYNARSFDGRYIGVQPLSAIEGEARPLWTF